MTSPWEFMCHIYSILNLLKYFLHNSLKLRRLKDFIDTLSCKLILIMFTFVVRLTVNIGYHTVFYYEQSALVGGQSGVTITNVHNT